MKAGVRCLVKGQSFKGIYPVVLKKVESFLVERYAPLVSGFKFHVSGHTDSTDNTEIIFSNTNLANKTNHLWFRFHVSYFKVQSLRFKD